MTFIKKKAAYLLLFILTISLMNPSAAQESNIFKEAEPNFIVNALQTPNDSHFNELWTMDNTGQTGGKPCRHGCTRSMGLFQSN